MLFGESNPTSAPWLGQGAASPWVSQATQSSILSRMRTMSQGAGRMGMFSSPGTGSPGLLAHLQRSSMSARASAAAARPGLLSAGSSSLIGGFFKANLLLYGLDLGLEVSGIKNTASTIGGGASAYMGRVSSGLIKPSAAGLYSGILQSAGQNMPWLGANVQRMYQPYEAAGARTSGILGLIARGGGEVDTTNMRAVYEQLLAQEKRAAGVDYAVDKYVAGKLADSSINSEALGALTGALSNLAGAITALATGGASGGARYLTGDR